MKIPSYWSRAVAVETTPEGEQTSLGCWRSSDISADDAHQSALVAARRALRSYLEGKPRDRYEYSAGPLREEVLQRFTNEQGELIAAVTQNAYGSLVLNAARAMFVDLDFPPTAAGEQMRHFAGRLFGSKGQSPDAKREQQAIEQLKQALARLPGWHVRVYRTCAGLRVLPTQAQFDPAADSTAELFVALNADPLYARLCRAQASFRARLTPKPWRCGHAANTTSWPRETPEAQDHFKQWNDRYIERQSRFATCRYVDTLGDGAIHPDVQTIIDIHDQATRCQEALPLA